MVLCLKGLKANHSYKYFFLKRLSVTYSTKRTERLFKLDFPLDHIMHYSCYSVLLMELLKVASMVLFIESVSFDSVHQPYRQPV